MNLFYELYAIEYFEEQRKFKLLEKVDWKYSNIIINLIEKGYLEPQDLPFVNTIMLKDSSINIINSSNSNLLFKLIPIK